MCKVIDIPEGEYPYCECDGRERDDRPGIPLGVCAECGKIIWKVVNRSKTEKNVEVEVVFRENISHPCGHF